MAETNTRESGSGNSARLSRGMQIAKAASRLSLMKPKVGAVVLRGGSVLGIGYNRAGSSKFSPWSRHAEVTALLAAGDARGATIVVYRGHGLSGEPMLARPCNGCAEAIALAGVKKVIYSEYPVDGGGGTK